MEQCQEQYMGAINGAINGANKQKILEMNEQVPTAWLLKLVGYNSEVTKNTIEKATTEAAFPKSQKISVKFGLSRGIMAKDRQDRPKTKCPQNIRGLRPNRFKVTSKINGTGNSITPFYF